MRIVIAEEDGKGVGLYPCELGNDKIATLIGGTWILVDELVAVADIR
jgi:hypothetical protein